MISSECCKLSIVIAYYKRSDRLLRILNSLAKQVHSRSTLQVIVADSGTLDETLDLDSFPFSVNVVNTKNILAAKRNIGIQIAEGSLIALLDDDCIPSSSYVEQLLHILHNADPFRPHIFSGQEVIRPVTTINSALLFYRKKNLLISDNKSSQRSTNLSPHRARAMNMAFFSSQREILPPFNESFTGYGWEDSAFFLDAINNGFELLDSPFTIYHEIMETPYIYSKKIFWTGYWFASFVRKYSIYGKISRLFKYVSQPISFLLAIPCLTLLLPIVLILYPIGFYSRPLYFYRLLRVLFFSLFLTGYFADALHTAALFVYPRKKH